MPTELPRQTKPNPIIEKIRARRAPQIINPEKCFNNNR